MQQRRTPPLQQQMGLPQLGLPGSPMYASGGGGGGPQQQQFGGGFGGALGSGMLQQAPQQQQPSGVNLAHLFQVSRQRDIACDSLPALPPVNTLQYQVR